MRDFFNHIKRVAVEDFKLYFEPFAAVWKWTRSLCKLIKEKVRQAMK